MSLSVRVNIITLQKFLHFHFLSISLLHSVKHALLCVLLYLWAVAEPVHGVDCAGLSDLSVRGDARRHFSRQAAQVFRRKFRQ
jgi:hypothetical protein